MKESLFRFWMGRWPRELLATALILFACSSASLKAETSTIDTDGDGFSDADEISWGMDPNAKQTAVYDFNSLSHDNLNGQDGWRTSVYGTGGDGQVITWTSNDSKAVQYAGSGPGAGVSGTRLNNAAYRFPQQGAGKTIVEIDVQPAFWGMVFGMGLDANGDGLFSNADIKNSDTSNTDMAWWMKFAKNTNGWQFYSKGTAATTTGNGGTGNSLTYARVRVVLDYEANGGSGSASVFVRDLGVANSAFAPVSGLQNLNLGLNAVATGVTNPRNWNGLGFHIEGATGVLDNLSISNDTDGDGLVDQVETRTGTYDSATNTGTNPSNPDSDNDGLKDGEEVITYGTNPLLTDTDGDGFSDKTEILAETDPNNATAFPDNQAPVITLIGANPLEVFKGTTFSDPGATVTDNRDVTRSITGTGTVNTATVGIYTLTYSATDAAGNLALPVTRTVNVVLDSATITMSSASGSYTLLQGAVPLDDSLTVSGDETFSGATIQIETGFAAGDMLNLTPSIGGITGIYDGTKGILTLSGSGNAAAYQAALRAVTFSTTSTSTAARGFKVTLGTAISFGGHYYEYVSGSYTWAQARALALGKTFNGLSGYLANISSADENSFVKAKIGADVWIGGSDQGTEGAWKWMDGPEAGQTFWNGLSNGSTPSGSYANWNSGEPNDSGGEDYAQFFVGTGKWNDLNSTSTLAFLVEYGTDTSAIQTFSGTRTFSVKAPLISSGFSHTLYLGAGASTVTAWGMNTDGRLGVGDMNSPVNWAKAVDGDFSVATVTGLAAGGTHSLILANGKVYAAGSDRFGQLGQGGTNRVNRSSFIQVFAPTSPVVAVSAGGNHSLALTEFGDVYACGDNTYGQLGNSELVSSANWIKVSIQYPSTGLSPKIVSVVAGADHNLAVDEDGGVWVWGRNNYGQLGKGTRTKAEGTPSELNLGKINDSDEDVVAESVAAGFSHSLILTTDGKVFGFGRNNSGQTGQSATSSMVLVPTLISGLNEIRLISAGTDSSFAIDGAGQLRSWGYNAYGELLLGYASPSSSPAVYGPTPSPIATNVFNVAGGGYSSLAVGVQGVIFGGRNDVGQSGNGPDPDEVVGDYYYGAGDLALTNLTMDLAGTEPSLYDQIFLGNGAVTLNGILNLMFVGTYTGPVYGSTQTFDLIWANKGITLGTDYKLAFNQAGYLVESAIVEVEDDENVKWKVLKATVGAVESDLDSDKADALALAQARLDGLENVSYRAESNETIGVSQLSASPSPVEDRVEMIYSYERPSGGVISGAEYFIDEGTYLDIYRVKYSSSSPIGPWVNASVTGTTVTPLGKDSLGKDKERVTLRISSSGSAGFLRLEVTEQVKTSLATPSY